MNISAVFSNFRVMRPPKWASNKIILNPKQNTERCIQKVNFGLNLISWQSLKDNFCTIFKKFWVSSTMCQDAISHEQYFDKEIKGKLILSKNSCTSNQSEPEVNSWVVLCRILSFFGKVSLLRLQL